MLKLYDLVPRPGGASFSPGCVRARLALMAKGVPFEVVQVTYHDLRFVWKDRLGVEKATAPFIEREDGSYLMDSIRIAEWLDETYPDRQNVFLPEAPLPVDVNSSEYKQALEYYKGDFQQKAAVPGKLLFSLYAPRLVPLFDEETREYWTSDARLGPGVWKTLSSATPETDAQTIKELHEHLGRLSEEAFRDGGLFIASPTKPGMLDFHWLGGYRLVRSMSASLAREIFEAPESAGFKAWLERMYAAYPMPEVWERDAKE
ncbi:hypothetical protein Rhopal_001607-T1 [Rhodotorula paludigena]|uniref:GST N-terminal domain-containing protein n=1 Tax=Rhodotorula paludigena TaxID=86838 RepID=A0AAV5G7U5_9BASI|nr:hypothetical protein Rhopal_001607-T1 [Rhodotorula paludigena]